MSKSKFFDRGSIYSYATRVGQDDLKRSKNLLTYIEIFWLIYVAVLPIGWGALGNFYSWFEFDHPLLFLLIGIPVMFLGIPACWLIASSAFGVRASWDNYLIGDEEECRTPSKHGLLRPACLPVYTLGIWYLINHEKPMSVMYGFGAAMFLLVLLLDAPLKKFARECLAAPVVWEATTNEKVMKERENMDLSVVLPLYLRYLCDGYQDPEEYDSDSTKGVIHRIEMRKDGKVLTDGAYYENKDGDVVVVIKHVKEQRRLKSGYAVYRTELGWYKEADWDDFD